MPVHKTKSGGYQWGSHGKIYHGKNAKQKAENQGKAAYANGYQGEKQMLEKSNEEIDDSVFKDMNTIQEAIRLAIRKVIKEEIREVSKNGYVVAAVDQSKQSYVPGDEDNIHILKMFPFSEYPEHKALESAIQFASENQASVYTMRPDGTYGEIVWPEKNLNEQDQDMVNILKGGDYATINGLAYHLKECGCNTTMGYKNGNHTLMVRRDFLPLAVDSLKNTCDRLGQLLGEKLENKYFKK